MIDHKKAVKVSETIIGYSCNRSDKIVARSYLDLRRLVKEYFDARHSEDDLDYKTEVALRAATGEE